MKRKPGREGLRQGLTGCIMNMFKDEKTSGFEYDRYTRTETGERLYANLRNYCREGLRKVDWVVNGYECYHRTVSTLINALIKAGFVIEECQEARIPDDLRKQYPALFGGTIHRPEFIFFRCRKSSSPGL